MASRAQRCEVVRRPAATPLQAREAHCLYAKYRHRFKQCLTHYAQKSRHTGGGFRMGEGECGFRYLWDTRRRTARWRPSIATHDLRQYDTVIW